MADNYAQFAEDFSFPKEAAADLKLFIDLVEEQGIDRAPQWFMEKYNLKTIDEVKTRFVKYGAEWTGINCYDYDEATGRFYMAAEDVGNINFLELVMPDIMEHYNIETPIAFEIAYTCSKARPGEFGGAVVVFWQGIVEWDNTQYERKRLTRVVERKIQRRKNNVLVNEQWTREDLLEVLVDCPYFEQHPEKLTDELVDEIGDYMAEAVATAVDNIFENIDWVARTKLGR